MVKIGVKSARYGKIVPRTRKSDYSLDLKREKYLTPFDLFPTLLLSGHLDLFALVLLCDPSLDL